MRGHAGPNKISHGETDYLEKVPVKKQMLRGKDKRGLFLGTIMIFAEEGPRGRRPALGRCSRGVGYPKKVGADESKKRGAEVDSAVEEEVSVHCLKLTGSPSDHECLNPTIGGKGGRAIHSYAVLRNQRLDPGKQHDPLRRNQCWRKVVCRTRQQSR